jgi:hypothetical protein
LTEFTQDLTTSADSHLQETQGANMIIERVDLDKIKYQNGISALSTLEVGESIFCSEFAKAQSLRALSYYFLKSRQLTWKFVFRKMDRGWRLIRVH